MTPEQLREQLARLDLSQNGAARALRVDPKTVRNWASGRSAIPFSVELALGKMTKPEAKRLSALQE